VFFCWYHPFMFDGIGFRILSILLLRATVFSLLLIGGETHAADFTMDFQANPSASSVQLNCNRGTGSVNCNNSLNPITDMTPILQEFVTVGSVQYQHQIIGDPTTGWVQEIYLDNSSGVCQNFSCFNNNPLGSAENATSFPTKAAIRQRMTSTTGAETFTMEFLKDTLLNKPKLTNTIVSDKMSYLFESDMRALDFSAANIANAAPVTITFSLLGPDAVIPPGVTLSAPSGGNFNLATDAPASQVESGQVSFDEATGVYSYYEAASSFNLDQDWAWFFELSQNSDCNSVRPECP